MKKVYIAHPYRGKTGNIEEIELNLKNVDKICKDICIKNDDILIFSPLHALSFFTYEDDQDYVLIKCKQMLSLCDELWVFGNWQTSQGCNSEIAHATDMNIPIIFFN